MECKDLIIQHINLLKLHQVEFINPNFHTCNTNDINKLEYLKNKLNDLIKIKAELELDNRNINKKLDIIDNEIKENNFEIKIAKRDIEEVMNEKINLETDLFKHKVNRNLIFSHR
jgi:hypothetical protein